jgi:type I restriction enzyme, S subunit
MEERELPVGWSTSSGSEIFELVTSGSRGWAKYYSDDGPQFIRIGNLNHGSIELDLEEVQHVTPPDDSEGKRTRLEPNDILISITAELGMVALVPEGLGEAYVNQHVALVRPSSEIHPRYLAWYLASESDGKKQLLDAKRGATKVGLGLPDIRNLILLLAPLNEQRRIAAKLDTTLAAVEACRQRLDGVSAILKRFRQAVLAAATSGELTREWREERGYDKAWHKTKIDQIATVRTGSTPLRSNPVFYDQSGIPWITSAATSAEIITSASEFVTEQGQVASRLRIYPKGTILVAMYGEGKTRGQVSELGIPATINQACAAIHDAIDAHLMPFIKIVLKANYFKMRDLAEGGNQPNLNLSKIKNFPIALPSKDEVFEVCDRVESLFTLADQLEARLTAARKIVDRLTPALLAKAFRGELVPQDPNDEPASVLLERIRAARQAEAGAGKPSRRGRPKAAANPDPLPLDAAPVPPDFLARLLRECGALSERALLAVSELEPERFEQQLFRELERGTAREVQADGQVLLEAVP